MTHLPSTALLGSVNLLEAIRASDAFGSFCLLVLAILSIVSFAVIGFKFLEIRRAKQQSDRFWRLVEAEGSWEQLFLASKENNSSPLATLLKETYVECRLEKWFRSAKVGVEGRLDIAKRTIEGILSRVMIEEEQRLQKQLPWLSVISGIAPLIGLLGTVWGVLAAFQALGIEGSSGIANLAPGVSTALTTTIFGLIAAIPAFWFHNKFLSDISALSSRMENFAHELENGVRKQILQDEEADA